MSEGHVIEFVYDGGTSPGTKRLLLVQDEYSNLTEGLDLNKNEVRKFTNSKMRQRKEYTDTVVLSTNKLQPELAIMLASKGYQTRVCDDVVVGYKVPYLEMIGGITIKNGKGVVIVNNRGLWKDGALITKDAGVDDVIVALQSIAN